MHTNNKIKNYDIKKKKINKINAIFALWRAKGRGKQLRKLYRYECNAFV